MAEGELGHLMGKEVGGFPTWVWLVIVGAGIAAAYILPKFLGGKGQQSQQATDQTGTSGLGLAIDPSTGLPYAVSGLVPTGGITSVPGGQLPPLPTPTPAPTPTPTPAPTPSTQPLIPYNYFSGGKFQSTGTEQGTKYTTITYGGQTYEVHPGAGGRVWGVPIGEGAPGQLLYAPKSYYGGNTPLPKPPMYASVQKWPYANTSMNALGSRYQTSYFHIAGLNPNLGGDIPVYPGQQVRIR